MPVLEQTLSIKAAIKTAGTGIAILLVYLFSVCLALKATAARMGTPIYDWVFLHPGPLGIILGGVWVLAPALLMGYATYRDMIGSGIGGPLFGSVRPGGLRDRYCSSTATGDQVEHEANGGVVG